MKQRIRVVGVIRSKAGILIFKRSRGRSESPVVWELPTGKIKFGEQPEEAMARSLTEFTGLEAKTVALKDVVTFLAPDGASQLSNLYIVYELTVEAGANPEPRNRYTAYKYLKDPTTGNVKLTETTRAVLEIEGAKPGSGLAGKPYGTGEETAAGDGRLEDGAAARATANAISIHVDGASRGNPGPSGIGYCIFDENGDRVEHGGEFIGFATSRLAEYLAMRRAVDRAIELGYKRVRFVADNLMVVNQLNGVFQVKNHDIMATYQDIRKKLPQFEAVSFTHVPRERNVCADKEANLAIDRILKK